MYAQIKILTVLASLCLLAATFCGTMVFYENDEMILDFIFVAWACTFIFGCILIDLGDTHYRKGRKKNRTYYRTTTRKIRVR